MHIWIHYMLESYRIQWNISKGSGGVSNWLHLFHLLLQSLSSDWSNTRSDCTSQMLNMKFFWIFYACVADWSFKRIWTVCWKYEIEKYEFEIELEILWLNCVRLRTLSNRKIWKSRNWICSRTRCARIVGSIGIAVIFWSFLGRLFSIKKFGMVLLSKEIKDI